MALDLLERRREQMFPKLTPAQLARLEAHSVRRATTAGQILLRVGETPRGLFVITVQFVHRVLRELAEAAPPHVIAAA